MSQFRIGTEMEQQYTIPLEPNPRIQANLIGHKALGILRLQGLTYFGFEVPNGFIITNNSYDELHRQFSPVIKKLMSGRTRGWDRTAKLIQNSWLNSIHIPSQFIFNQIEPEYQRLCERNGVVNLGVAVRSSGVYEDLRSKSYAGAYESFLNVKGIKSLVEHVLRCYAKAWKVHLLRERKKNIIPMNAGMAIIIQKQISSDVSGVTFTADPLTGDLSKISINSAWGLGDVLVSGRINADIFTFDKQTMKLLQKRIGEKTVASRCQRAGGTTLESVTSDKSYSPSLTHEDALRVAQVCSKVENKIGLPVDIEWAISNNILYLLQVRPITTL